MPATINHLLPPKPAFRVVQSPGKPAGNWLDKTEALIVVLPEQPAAAVWSDLPDGSTLRKVAQQHDFKRILNSRLPNKAATSVHLRQLPDTGTGNLLPTTFSLLTQAGGLAAAALADKPSSVGVVLAGFDPAVEANMVNALLLALAAHEFKLPSFKSKAGKLTRVKTVRVAGTSQRLDLDRPLAEAEGLNVAR